MLKALHNYLVKLKFNRTLPNGKGICYLGYKNLANEHGTKLNWPPSNTI